MTMHAEPQLGQQLAANRANDPLRAFAMVVLCVAVVVVLFLPTFMSMVSIWERSDTFAHGYLIFPAFLWFAWQRRAELAATPVVPFWPGIAATACVGFGWLLGDIANVGVVKQFALIAMICTTLMTVFGWRWAWALAFPLGFLLFAVPVGEALIPPMMEATADFVQAALKMSGIPVYREGLFLVIPSGNWSIIEGCSGLRYLIASATVGCVYAYLTYRSLSRRLVFCAAAVIVPIIANWLRAYIIVMLGHLSGNRIAVGVDHLIYGWVFFGFVMLLLFWAGSFWREDEAVPQARPGPVRGVPLSRAARGQIGLAVVAALAALLAWPAWSAYMDKRADVRPIQLSAPVSAGGWTRQSDKFTTWRPRYEGAKSSLFEAYQKDGRHVALYIAAYRNQRPGADLLTSTNRMVEYRHPEWGDLGAEFHVESTGRSLLPLRETRLRSAQQRLLIWDWNIVSGRELTNAYLGKALLARDKLLGRGDDGFAIIMATPYEDPAALPRETLRDFIRDMRPLIDAALAGATGQ